MTRLPPPPLWLAAGLWLGIALPTVAAPPAPTPLPAEVRSELEAARDALHQAARRYADLLDTHGLPSPGPMGLGDPLRGHLGLRLGPADTLADGQKGLRIMAVAEAGGAAQAGVTAGDVLLAVNGVPVGSSTEGVPNPALRPALADLTVGQTVPVRVARAGQVLALNITTTAAPPSSERRHRRRPDSGPLAWQLAPMSAALAPYFGGLDHGVLLLRVPDDSRFALQPGDVITAVDGTAVDSPRSLFKAVLRGEGETTTLRLQRLGSALELSGPRPQRPRLDKAATPPPAPR
ncbi:PDZ domain-containing protein [Flagellatimonas centrodinii]|uniref:PDZ domain-containing protein n=1 Tax=Flagellatimonas centrodinii TaxID=2806210 RepID=UPI001FEDE47F|nr:PDZ domain-containing protein [Flagellatimonas centrodinii]ULQ47583.1 PDZ domain-containing protein [Flagellatimonas centrodinii]